MISIQNKRSSSRMWGTAVDDTETYLLLNFNKKKRSPHFDQGLYQLKIHLTSSDKWVTSRKRYMCMIVVLSKFKHHFLQLLKHDQRLQGMNLGASTIYKETIVRVFAASCLNPLYLCFLVFWRPFYKNQLTKNTP